MKALTWHGTGDIRCESVPDPRIEDARDAIIKVTACAICGSDLHIFNGVMPGMQSGDVLGHETMGEVVEVGSDTKKLKVGDRIVVPYASKAFLDNFSYALANELKETKVTVSCLMPGPTETEFFRRADMLDTSVGQAKKDDAAKVARDGFQAMMSGESDIVSGWKNKLQATIANIVPSEVLAEQHRRMAKPAGR